MPAIQLLFMLLSMDFSNEVAQQPLIQNHSVVAQATVDVPLVNKESDTNKSEVSGFNDNVFVPDQIIATDTKEVIGFKETPEDENQVLIEPIRPTIGERVEIKHENAKVVVDLDDEDKYLANDEDDYSKKVSVVQRDDAENQLVALFGEMDIK